MKKLKKKVFLVVFLILTLITTAGLCVYNAQFYSQQHKSVERSLNDTMNLKIGGIGMVIDPPDFEEKPEAKTELGNIRFMDSTVYTVFLSDDNSVSGIVNHSNNDTSDEEIEALAESIITNCTETEVIGNLYFTEYSYKLESGNYITIVDNSNTNKALADTLFISLLLYVLLELAILLISKRITVWIAEPVAESFEKQKQFIADASHELKTPLAVIMASADALDSNPTEKKWLDNIKSESERMNKLIADLLDLAKSEEVEDKEQFAVSSLSKLVEKSVLTFEGIMFEKGIMLIDDIEDGIEINMSEFKIQQLMSILLDNAIKHSENGGEIRVELKKDKDIVLTVTNKGEGIPKGEEERIFERFYRADEARNRNDNRYGLGLAIAKNICLNHNADISALSENGSTTFKVVFKA